MDREFPNSTPFPFPYVPLGALQPVPSPYGGAMPQGARLPNSSSAPRNNQAIKSPYGDLTNKEWLNKVDGEFKKLDGLFGGLLKDANNSAATILRLEQQVQNDRKVMEALMIEKRRLEAKNHRLEKELQLQMARAASQGARLPSFSLE
ncbi:hypothetical protein TWF506_005997 [Arthrobotrys conoides]|uniref:Uncharacterized protein n=1 Tax=Arthrobotrys conoides TaxID=74498 RepID=A0AAN8N884_9PEZI